MGGNVTSLRAVNGEEVTHPLAMLGILADHCVDAKTGVRHWRHDTAAHIWGSTLVADGKVYLGNEDGYMTILPASKTLDPKKDVREVDMTSQIFSSPIAANGVLYVATHTHLFAIDGPER